MLRGIEREVDGWLETGELAENNAVLEQGLRYSREAVRRMAYKVAAGTKITHKDLGFLEPHPDPMVSDDFSFQYKASTAFYLWFSGVISTSEYKEFFRALENTSLIDRWSDYAFTKPDSLTVRNVIRPNAESVARDIKAIKDEVPDAVTVFNHGKWNGPPHVGYMEAYSDVMDQLREMGISEKRVIFIIANDTNNDIKLAGAEPFLNTAWRITLNSALPYDILFSSGDIPSWEEADRYWGQIYRVLQPNYLIVETNDRLAHKKIERVKSMGEDESIDIQPLLIERRRFVVIDEDGEVIGPADDWQKYLITQSGFMNVENDIFAWSVMKNNIARAKVLGFFDRKANWRDFLLERGLL